MEISVSTYSKSTGRSGVLIKDVGDVVKPSEHYARMVAVELLVGWWCNA